MHWILFVLYDDSRRVAHNISKAQLSSLILNFARLLLDGDPVDGHRAADLAPPAAAALTGIVALGDVVLVTPGNEPGVRPPAAAVLW